MRRVLLAASLAAVGATLVFALGASGTQLPGSTFEIDNDANFVVNTTGNLDWANVTESRQVDLATGQNDDSYAGGSKEDDTCPGTTTGSIPNNKSDLLTFGAYTEGEVGGPGFLNIFWSRVNNPSGTTLMDFELNHSTTDCGNGVNRVRTPGDLLIEYSIDQGGSQATITVREWTGTAWGPQQDLTSQGLATGTINTSPISAANSDGLISTGSLAARTFGEAQLDLDFVFKPGVCESFGSAMLKSRSSDAGPSQMKDFIRPVPVNIQNCGKVIVRKVTDPPGQTQSFGYTKTFTTDPASANTFSLTGASPNNVKTFDGALFGAGSVTEDASLPPGWSFVSLNCGASTGVTPSVVGQTASWSIDAATDIVDCTYTNRLQQGAIKITKQTIKSGNAGLQDAEFTITGPGGYSSGTLKSGADGTVCVDGLAHGAYTVTETKAPNGYAIDTPTGQPVTVNNNAKCSDTPFVGEPITFTDTPLTDILVRAKSQATGGTASRVTCKNAANVNVGNSPQPSASTFADPAQVDATGLAPGTYTCVIIIDP